MTDSRFVFVVRGVVEVGVEFDLVMSIQLQICCQAVQAALAAPAALFVTAEWRRWVEAIERIRPHHAGSQLLHHRKDARPLLRPHARR